ncbi:hypothetical protein HQ587_06080 [bacterium]|nr:hypothetical protein [bacterium]
MSATIKVTDLTGTLKKIEAQYLKVGGDFTTAWNHPNAVTVTKIQNNDINIKNRESLLIEEGESVTLEFKPNLTGLEGQGMVKIPFKESYDMNIAAVTSGDVFIIEAKDITVTDDIVAIWGRSKTIALGGEKLKTGDYILCKTSGYFSVEIKMPFTASGILPPAFIIEMPGLEEGLNEINIFCVPILPMP